MHPARPHQQPDHTRESVFCFVFGFSNMSRFAVSLTDRSDTAILYNDRSVLESHHVSAAYRLLQDDDEMNILYNLSKDDWRSEKQIHRQRVVLPSRSNRCAEWDCVMC